MGMSDHEGDTALEESTTNDPISHHDEEFELDYEADEEVTKEPDDQKDDRVVEDSGEVPEPKKVDAELEDGEDGAIEPEEGEEGAIENKDGEEEHEQELESGEELEEGELSDEDEETRKERLKPQPTCRFFSKGQCTWGTSCRFKHPGVLDKGNYSMFSAPKPILPGAGEHNLEETVALHSQTEAEAELLSPNNNGDSKSSPEKLSPLKPPPIPKVETAWERGLRQAKEMRKLSQKRKETDVEYEEKRTTMSLTQAELDKENDFYARQASPIHEDTFSDYEEDPYEPSPVMGGTQRRVAPPPPDDFYAFGGPSNHRHRPGQQQQRFPPPLLDKDRRMERRYSESPPPQPLQGRIGRRVAPPRSPEGERGEDPRSRRGGFGGGGAGEGRGDEWADPWMRRGGGGGEQRGRRSGERRDSTRRQRSYSSGSSRSSSGSSSSRSRKGALSRKKLGRKGRSSSDSSRSSRSSSDSRSRSSTPDNIPRRRRRSSGGRSPPLSARRPAGSGSHHPGLISKTNTAGSAPLQKRLGSLASSSNTIPVRNIKKEPSDRGPPGRGRRRKSSSSSRSSRSPSPVSSRKRRESLGDRRLGGSSNHTKPAVPPVVSLDESISRSDLAVRTGNGREKPSQISSAQPPPQQQPPPPPPPVQQQKQSIKMTLKTSSISAKPANRTVLEKLGMTSEDLADSTSRKRKATETTAFAPDVPTKSSGEKSKKPEKKKKERKSAADRREELLKQLKAVENAIAKKRTKMDD